MQKRMQRIIVAVGDRFPELGNVARVEEIIQCVLKAWRQTKPRSQPGREDDERDIRNWSSCLSKVSKAHLEDIVRSKPGEVKRSLFAHTGPFNRVPSREQGFLETLSGRVIIKIAGSLLQDRQISQASRKH